MRLIRAVLPGLLLALILSTAACTDSGDRAGATDSPSPSPSPSLVVRTGGYVYRAPGIEATLELTGEQGRLVVLNSTGFRLQAPGVYLLDARDGLRVDGEVAAATPIPNGQTREFEVSVPGAPEPKHIGIVALLFGPDDFGAFEPAEEDG